MGGHRNNTYFMKLKFLIAEDSSYYDIKVGRGGIFDEIVFDEIVA